MKKIKLMHLQVLPILSGVQNMMLMLLSGLEQDKYEITVISRGNGPLVDKVKEYGWEHISIESLSRELCLKDFLSAWKLYWIFKKEKPDIVHTHSSKTGFLGRVLAKMAGVPRVIHTTHGFPFHPYQNRISRCFYAILETYASFFSDFNVFVNLYEKELAIHKLGFNKNKALTIYNGILPFHTQKVYEESYLENDTLKIVSVLRFSKQKNIISTIKQAVKVVKRFKNVHFTFIGDGELYEECCNIVNNSFVAEISDFNPIENITLSGWVSDIPEKLLSFDVFLLNSLWEGLPISILEAMSVSLPIICSNIKGNNELVSSSNGWLIDPLDSNALENVISEILENKNILKEKGNDSLKKVTNLFHYELFISEYEKIYDRG